MNVDVDDLLGRIDCRDVVAQDLGAPEPRHARGKYNVYACPFHDDRKPSLAVYQNGFKCFGCGQAGNAIWWLKLYRGMSFSEAFTHLGGEMKSDAPVQKRARVVKPTPPSEPPGLEWQAAGMEVVVAAQRALWSPAGRRARAYLRGRGISDEMIYAAQLGYVPGHFKEWRTMAGLNVPCGILIPWVIENDLWQLKVRRSAGSIKYQQVAGGSGEGLYWIDKIDAYGAVMIVEGEFDAMVINQTGVMGAVALGTASNTVRPRWVDRLIFARRIYARLDDDAAGRGGCERLQAVSSRIVPVQVPTGMGKDNNDFYLADAGCFRRWLREMAV